MPLFPLREEATIHFHFLMEISGCSDTSKKRLNKTSTQTNPPRTTRTLQKKKKKGLPEVATEGKGKINILDSPSVCVFSLPRKPWFIAGRMCASNPREVTESAEFQSGASWNNSPNSGSISKQQPAASVWFKSHRPNEPVSLCASTALLCWSYKFVLKFKRIKSPDYTNTLV